MIYKNAPIREAIFDIQVQELRDKTFEDFAKFHLLLRDKFANQRKINSFERTFRMDGSEDDNSKTDAFFKGVILSDKETKKQVQYRIDGFSLNFLAPYSNWEEFKNEAYLLWKIFINEFPEITATRIALRYINRIEIPLPLVRFEDYVNNIPPIPNVLPNMYKSFFSQVEVPCHDPDFSAIISVTIETPTVNYVPYILDIDVYKNLDLGFEFGEFEYIRKVKNEIFESCITAKTRELLNI